MTEARTRIRIKRGTRPGLPDGARAVWAVTYYALTEDGNDGNAERPGWTVEIDAVPKAADIVVAHTAFHYLLRTDPDIPELDFTSCETRLLGYVDASTNERLHGVRCSQCGSDKITFQARGWAICQACGHGQMQADAILCPDHCVNCEAAAS